MEQDKDTINYDSTQESFSQGAHKIDRPTCSLLTLAAGWSLPETAEQDVKKCLAAGADINEKNENGDTPLHIAVRTDLYDLGIMKDANGKHRIYTSAKRVDKDANPGPNRTIVPILLELGADVNAKNNKGETPLVSATDYDMVKLLLEHGAAPNVQDANGDTPLHMAALVGNKKSIRFLLEHGANPAMKNHSGFTPFGLALTFGNTDMADFLRTITDVNKTNSSEELNIALVKAIRGDWSALSALIDYGADVNFVEESGDSVLMDAVNRGNPTWLIQKLIDAGADVNFINKSGDSVLMKATHSNNSAQIVKLLIDAGVNINATDKLGKSALMREVEGEEMLVDPDTGIFLLRDNSNSSVKKRIYNKEIIRLLVNAGANVNHTDNSGKSVLQVALENKDGQEVVDLLKSAGAGKTTPKPANTPSQQKELQNQLVKACSLGKINNVQALLDQGADINAPDSFGDTPLKRAIWSKSPAIVKLLLQRGARVNAELFTLAQNGQNAEIIQLLKSAEAKE